MEYIVQDAYREFLEETKISMEFGREQQIAFVGDRVLFCLGIVRESRTEPQNRKGCFVHMDRVCI